MPPSSQASAPSLRACFTSASCRRPRKRSWRKRSAGAQRWRPSTEGLGGWARGCAIDNTIYILYYSIYIYVCDIIYIYRYILYTQIHNIHIYIYCYVYTFSICIHIYIYIRISIYNPYGKIYKWEFSNFPHVYGCMRKRKDHDDEPPSGQEPIYSWEFSIYN